MCGKWVNKYLHALEFAPDRYKTRNMRNKAVDTHSSTIQFVPECYNADKAIRHW